MTQARTPSGNPIHEGDKICPVITYRVVKVGEVKVGRGLA